MTHWIYPVNPKGDYYIVLRGRRVSVTIENVLKDLKEGDKDWWHVTAGYASVRRDDLVWVCFSDIGQLRVLARATGQVRVSRDGGHQIQLQWSEGVTRRLQSTPIGKDVFGRTPQNAMWRAKPGVADALDRWLGGDSPVAAPGFDPSTAEDDRKRVQETVVQREGQPGFRDKLMAVYGRRCAVTGTRLDPVLEASHIYPYTGPDSNEVTNGLLLRSDVHKLFDGGYLCVDEDFRVRVDPSLRRTDYKSYHGQRLHLHPRAADRPRLDLLRQHRSLLAPWFTDRDCQ
jgi:hypothetical protein